MRISDWSSDVCSSDLCREPVIASANGHCSLRPMRILLVEDTEDLAEAIVRRVRRSGHAIDWEADGTQADDILRVQRYDLVVLDITLPGRSGFDIDRKSTRLNSSP